MSRAQPERNRRSCPIWTLVRPPLVSRSPATILSFNKPLAAAQTGKCRMRLQETANVCFPPKVAATDLDRPRTPISSVAERLDFLGQAVFLLDGDPFEHLEPLFQLLHFVAQAQGFPIVRRRHFDAVSQAGSPEAQSGANDRCKHHDRDD